MKESFSSNLNIKENPNKEEFPSFVMMFVGDIMLDRGVERMVEKHGNGDYKFPFLKIKSYLDEADLLFGNLESQISDKGSKIGVIPFQAHPKALEGLSWAGFDVVSVANNHIFDYGRKAMEDSFLRLKKAGIDYVGGGFNEKEAYSPVIKEIKGTKIAFLAYTNLAAPYWLAKGERSGIAWLEKERMIKEIEATKKLADLVIVSFHYGEEYQTKPNPFQISISQAAIEAGADLVVGHHSHVIQPLEKYREGYIAYSLGNFVFDMTFSKETRRGKILKVLVEKGKIKEVIPIEIKINKYFQPEFSKEIKLELEDLKEIYQNNSLFQPKPASKKLPHQLVRCLYTIKGVPSPKGIAFNPQGDEFWVTSLMNKTRGIVIFEAKTGRHKRDIVLSGGGGVEIIFNNEGNLAFVSQMETGRIFEINATTKEVLRIFDTQSSWTKVLTLSPDQKFLYASNWAGNDVSVIDLEGGKLVEKIPTVLTPRGIYVVKDGKNLYLAGFGKGEIQKIDLETRTSSVLYRSGGAMRHIVGDEEKGVLYFSDMAKNIIYQLNLKTDEVKEFAKTDNNPNTIVLTPNKRVLIVSNRGANHPSGKINIPGPEWGSILFFDTTTGKILDALVAGNQPTGLAISPDGRYLVYSDFLDANLTFCEIPSYEELIAGQGGRSSIYHQELKK